ncbi:MAG: hypothetical protein ACLFS8_01530 [Clostridia bacterium]
MSANLNPSLLNREIRLTRALPLPGEILVQVGEVVRPDTVVAKAKFLSGSPYVVDIGPDLRKSPETRICVEVGQQVVEGDVVAQSPVEPFEARSPIEGVVEYISRSRGRIYLREHPGSERAQYSVNIVEDLRVWPAVAWMHVRVSEGDTVEEGEILAAAAGADGANYAYAPFEGTIERFDREAGMIVISRHVEEYTMHAYIAGTVEEFVGGRGVKIRGEVARIGGVYGIGPEAIGPLRVVGNLRDLEALPPGAILAFLEPAESDSVLGALQTEPAGLVAGGMDWADLKRVSEEVGDVPIVVISGFGSVSMPPQLSAALARFDGETVSMSGSGPSGAEVLLPGVLEESHLQRRVCARPVRTGDVARCLGTKGFGELAKVTVDMHRAVYPNGMEIPSVGIEPQGGGETRVTPVANVEPWCRPRREKRVDPLE